jgi:hypothetical protein
MSDPETRQSTSLGYWAIPAGIHALIIGMILARMVVVGPAYNRTYKDYGLLLPAASEATITLSESVAGSLWLVVPLVFAFWCLDAVVLWQLGERDRRVGWSWFWVGCAILVLLWFLVEFTLLLPMWKLREALRR